MYRKPRYGAGTKIMFVDMTSNGAALTLGTPRPQFGSGNVSANHADYFADAVAKDGQRCLVSRPVSSAAAPSPIVVVLDWSQGIDRAAQ